MSSWTELPVTMPMWTTGAVVGFVVSCCAMDLRRRRIPNAFSVTCTAAALIADIWYCGPSGLLHGVAGMLIAVGVLFGPFALGGIGGGDVKMMAAVGALLGPASTLVALCLGFIFGGLLMVAHLARIGRLKEKLGSTVSMLSAAAGARSLAPLRSLSADPTAVTLPYSVALGLGTIAAILAMSGSVRV